MSTITVQNDFTHGEFDPRMDARFDTSLYNKGAKQLRDVVVITQGGARRRFGTEFIDDPQIFGTNVKMEEFLLTEDEAYLLLIIPNEIRIYLKGSLVTIVASPYQPDEIRDLKVAQTTNLLLIVHPNHQPRQLLPPGVILQWTLSLYDFKFVPAHDFRNNYRSDTFTLGSTVVGSGVSLTSSGTPFVRAHVGGIFTSAGKTLTDPLGYARITSYVSTSSVIVQITSEFANTANPGKDSVLAEKSWSSIESDNSGDRGWPISVTFYQSRLWFGGARSLPETVFSSKIGDFQNYDVSIGLDDDPIIEKIATNSFNPIKHIVGNRSLQIFTFSAEFSNTQNSDQPLTPSNAGIRLQSSKGSTNVDPVIIDNQTIFVARGGKGIYSFVYDFDVNAYKSDDVSLVSAHLINNPIDSAVLKGSPTDDSDYVFFINTDGTLAVYQTRKSENISAWTLATTPNGRFIAITEVGSDIFAIVERTIQDIKINYLEKLTFDRKMDGTIVQTFLSEVTIITGLEKLEGQEVGIIGDDFYFGKQVVFDGEVTVESPVNKTEVGIVFDPVIEPLPVVFQTNMINGQQSIVGTAAYTPRRYVRVFVQFYESLGILIEQNGAVTEIPSLEFGSEVLDQVPDPQTGVHEYRGMGWSTQPTIIITQESPLPMTILAIGYEVET